MCHDFGSHLSIANLNRGHFEAEVAQSDAICYRSFYKLSTLELCSLMANQSAASHSLWQQHNAMMDPQLGAAARRRGRPLGLANRPT